MNALLLYGEKKQKLWTCVWTTWIRIYDNHLSVCTLFFRRMAFSSFICVFLMRHKMINRKNVKNDRKIITYISFDIPFYRNGFVQLKLYLRIPMKLECGANFCHHRGIKCRNSCAVQQLWSISQRLILRMEIIVISIKLFIGKKYPNDSIIFGRTNSLPIVIFNFEYSDSFILQPRPNTDRIVFLNSLWILFRLFLSLSLPLTACKVHWVSVALFRWCALGSLDCLMTAYERKFSVLLFLCDHCFCTSLPLTWGRSFARWYLSHMDVTTFFLCGMHFVCSTSFRDFQRIFTFFMYDY